MTVYALGKKNKIFMTGKKSITYKFYKASPHSLESGNYQMRATFDLDSVRFLQRRLQLSYRS